MSIKDDASVAAESEAEVAYEAPEEEGVLTRFHGHHQVKVGALTPRSNPCLHVCTSVTRSVRMRCKGV